MQPWKAWGVPTVGSLAAARASALGHAVVQSTGAYFDWEYSTNELIEDGLREMEGDFLGGEAALWTERIDYTNAECRLWPRLLAVADVLWAPLPDRVRLHIIRNVRIKNVGKYQSCMFSKLRIICKQTVPVQRYPKRW